MTADEPDELPPPLPLDVSLGQAAALPAAGLEVLRSPDVGLRLIRGTVVRGAGYGIGMLLTALASIVLLRYLDVADFGRYATVTSLIAIVAGLTDAGLTAVASRDLAVLPGVTERRTLLANILGLRIIITPIGVIAALVFAIVAGYDETLIVGTLLAGVGLILLTAQGTMTLPLSVELKIGRLTAIEVIKQAVMLAAITMLVLAGGGLTPFFVVPVVVGVVSLLVTPALVGRGLVWMPAFDRPEWKRLIRETLPLAAAVVVGIFYFRLLMILMSLLASAVETGYFAASFRVTEILYGIATLAVTIALPVLAVAAEERARLRYMLQRMIEVSMIAACYFIIVGAILAQQILMLLGGDQYDGAVPVLRIQLFALVPVFLAQVFVVGLISLRRQSGQVIANLIALPLMLGLGLALIPVYGSVGAAVTALIAESAYCFALIVLFTRRDRTLQPSFAFIWKVVAASALAAAALLVPGVPAVVTAIIATAGYLVGLLVTRAIPREVLDAFVLRNRSTSG